MSQTTWDRSKRLRIKGQKVLALDMDRPQAIRANREFLNVMVPIKGVVQLMPDLVVIRDQTLFLGNRPQGLTLSYLVIDMGCQGT